MHYFHFISCMGLHRIVSKKNSHSNHVYQMRILMIICAEIIVYICDRKLYDHKKNYYVFIYQLTKHVYRLKVEKKRIIYKLIIFKMS